ncbi:hypothetical protein QE392_000959 [Microbacterium proteolyticum]|nr:hypothetical protein [Microbacterium proteolyticum]
MNGGGPTLAKNVCANKYGSAAKRQGTAARAYVRTAQAHQFGRVPRTSATTSPDDTSTTREVLPSHSARVG